MNTYDQCTKQTNKMNVNFGQLLHPPSASPQSKAKPTVFVLVRRPLPRLVGGQQVNHLDSGPCASAIRSDRDAWM